MKQTRSHLLFAASFGLGWAVVIFLFFQALKMFGVVIAVPQGILALLALSLGAAISMGYVAVYFIVKNLSKTSAGDRPKDR